MPDPWETEHDLDPADALDASSNADGDGYTNIEEYLNGSDSIARQTSIEEKPKATHPTDFALAQNYPNPFNSEILIRFSLPKGLMVTLALYNLAGQHLNTLVSEKRKAGVYAVHWDGRDAAGNDLASGAYIHQLEAGELSRSRKLLMLR